MNTKIKLCIPLAIIIVTLTSAVVAGIINGDKLNQYGRVEVFAQTETYQEVLTQSKPLILSIINSNISESAKTDKALILDGIETHMAQFDKGKNQDFKNSLEYKLQDLSEIINIENKELFEDMSLDAKIPAMKLLANICEEYGITITYNLEGRIVKISELSGTDIYVNEMMKDNEVSPVAFIFTLGLIICFITFCIYIARKKQLFIKDGMYDGYNKEGFA